LIVAHLQTAQKQENSRLNKIRLPRSKVFPVTRSFVLLCSAFLLGAPAYALQAGGDPWDTAVNVLKQAFTGPIATGLSLVAIVIGGLMFAFGEGQSKRVFAGIIFGIGMAVGAANFNIDPVQNVWHCKGACLEGGDVIEWVMRAEGISSRHAVELLERDHLPSAASTTEPPPKQSTVPHCGSYVSFD
jgi:type IV secretory pathway VirB2 component (pilin)